MFYIPSSIKGIWIPENMDTILDTKAYKPKKKIFIKDHLKAERKKTTKNYRSTKILNTKQGQILLFTIMCHK